MDLEDEFVRKIDIKLDDREEWCLQIHQKTVGDVGCVVWDAALVLLKFIFTEKGRQYIEGKNVLELGSGTGAVGIAASAAGAKHVMVTDLPEFVPLMETNIKKNIPFINENKLLHHDMDKVIYGSTFSKECCLNAAVYKWGNSEDKTKIFNYFKTNSQEIDCVLIADCIYYEEGVLKLHEEITNILTQYPSAIILCCYEFRTTGNKPKLLKDFIKLLNGSDISLNLSYVDENDMDPVYRSDDIKILLIKCA